MDSSHNSKKIHIVYLLASSAALAGMALYYFSKQQKQLGDIIDDVKYLGEVKYTDKDKKLIEERYFTDLVALVRMHTAIEFKAEKAELIEKRQALYKCEV